MKTKPNSGSYLKSLINIRLLTIIISIFFFIATFIYLRESIHHHIFHSDHIELGVQLSLLGLTIGIVLLLHSHVKIFHTIGLALSAIVLGVFISIMNNFVDLKTLNLFYLEIQLLVLPYLGAAAGEEVDFSLIKEKGGKKVIYLVILRILVPFVVGSGVALLFYLKGGVGIFPTDSLQLITILLAFGSLMTVRALPILITFFLEKGIQKSLPARLAITASSVDDIFLYIFMLEAIMATLSGGGLISILEGTFFLVLLMLIIYSFKKIYILVDSKFSLNIDALSFGICTLFLAGGLAEIFGVHLLISGILWGLLMSKEIVSKTVKFMSGFMMKILVPLFFLSFFAGLTFTPTFFTLLIALILVIIDYILHKTVTNIATKKLIAYPEQCFTNFFVASSSTKGVPQIIFGQILYSLGILTTDGLIVIILFAVISTFWSVIRMANEFDKNKNLYLISVKNLH